MCIFSLKYLSSLKRRKEEKNKLRHFSIKINLLTYYMYLSGLGEQWPFFDPERIGQIQNAHISTILV